MFCYFIVEEVKNYTSIISVTMVFFLLKSRRWWWSKRSFLAVKISLTWRRDASGLKSSLQLGIVPERPPRAWNCALIQLIKACDKRPPWNKQNTKVFLKIQSVPVFYNSIYLLFSMFLNFSVLDYNLWKINNN